MPAPACTLGGKNEPQGKPSTQSPPVLREAGCRLPPSPVLELVTTLAEGVGSCPGPHNRQDQTQMWLAVFLCFSLVLRAGSQLC